jgi:hypothetical protein
VSTVVAAVVKLIRIFSPLVIVPLFQLLALLQSLLDPLPVQVSVVVGGGAFGFVLRADAVPPAVGWLNGSCLESLRLDPAAACADAKPAKLQKTARRQRTVIQGAAWREVDGRMGLSGRKFCVLN